MKELNDVIAELREKAEATSDKIGAKRVMLNAVADLEAIAERWAKPPTDLTQEEEDEAHTAHATRLRVLSSIPHFARDMAKEFQSDNHPEALARAGFLAIAKAVDIAAKDVIPRGMAEASEIGMRSALNFEQFQHAGSVVAVAREKLNHAATQLELANIRYRHREFISQSDPAMKIAGGNPMLRPKLIAAVNWLMSGRLPEAK